jgi:hypothetical protein
MGQCEAVDSLQLPWFLASRTYREQPFLMQAEGQRTLQNYFRRFVHLRAQAPNVLDAVAINAAIVGLRAG